MKFLPLSFLVISVSQAASGGVEFAEPVALKVDGQVFGVASPGFAAPAVADLDGDGVDELLVGEFSGGRIHLFSKTAEGEFGSPSYLQAEGAEAQVPGVG